MKSRFGVMCFWSRKYSVRVGALAFCSIACNLPVAAGEGLVIENGDRPRVGVPLVASISGEGHYDFKWSRQGLTTAEETVSESSQYTPTEADYEHWLKAVALNGEVPVGECRIYFSKLPVVYLNTDDGAAITDKVNYVSGTLRIQGNAEFSEQYNGKTEIKGRGNSSWGFPQKPYKLKLDKKTDLFGFGKNKHWVLISDYVDNAFMRNKHGSELAKELGILGMDMTWVTVILNGTYYGVEMFSEHIRVGEKRVEVFDWESKAEEVADSLYDAAKKSAGWKKDDKSAIEELMSTNFSWISSGVVAYKGNAYRLADYGLMEDWDLSGGYLYEMDGRWDEVSKFQTAQMLTKINVSKPEYVCSDVSMMLAATNIWNLFEEAYLSIDNFATDKHISAIADMDSMVGYWLTLECLGNVDSRAFSRYSYVDQGGKLMLGPVWDFDYGGGSIAVSTGYGDAALPDHWAICCFPNAPTGGYPGSDFYCEWLDDPLYALKAYEMYWRKVRPWMAAEIAPGGGMDQKVAYLSEAGDAHDTKFKRWGFNGEDGDVAKYRQYLTTRLTWLDQQFKSVDGLMASVRNDTSAHPYDKADDVVKFVFARGVLTNEICNTDFAVERGGGEIQMSLAVADKSVSDVDVYLNGLKYRRVAVANGVADVGIFYGGVDSVATNRMLISVIARDSSAAVVARNYATVQLVGAGTPGIQLGVVGQRYPWNGLVDIEYRVWDLPDDADCLAVFTITVPNEEPIIIRREIAKSDGVFTLTWDAAEVFPERRIDGVTIRAALDKP